MKPVLLWTDFFIFLMLSLSVLFIYLKRQDLMMHKLWNNLIGQPRILIATMILMFYAAIGIIDSLHFKESSNQHRVFSALDWILRPYDSQSEVTYSAPFASTGFVSEMQLDAQGKRIEVYPKLQIKGAELNATQKFWDIAGRVSLGLFISLLIFLILYFMGRTKIQENIPIQSRSYFWFMLFTLIAFVSILGCLMFNYHVLGTDKVGRDVLYLCLKSIRTGLVIGTITTFVMLPFALFFGTYAGYFRGWVDDLIQYIYTTLSSVPGVLLIAAAVLSLQTKIEQNPDLRLLMLCIILGVTSWTSLCRLLRGETLKLRETEFVQAAQVLGVKKFKIIIRHIIPNLMHIVIITLILDFSGLVLAEAVLSYIGVGVDPSSNSFGNMINAARLEMAREPVVWWSLFGAFGFMFGLVFSANIVSENLQNTLNPRS